jgi:TRAP-type C4-dicarboxylate transport system substrate-binding protein
MLRYFVLALAFHAASAQAATQLTIASVAPKDSPWEALLVKFKDAVEKRSQGALKVKLMVGGVLGDENDAVLKASRGQIQAVAASTGAFASKVPELNLVELPFLFRNTDEADAVLDEVLTEPMEGLFKKRGLIFGFWNENGYRMFASREKPILKMADLAGLKMRAQENPVHIAMYKAFSAAATPIPVTEVSQALATGNVDGFDQALLFMIAAGWQKSVKHVTLSEHIYQPAAVAFHQGWFEKLKPEHQKILVEEGRALQKKGRKAVRGILGELKEILVYDKIQVHELSPAARKEFEAASQNVYQSFRKDFGAEASRLLDLTLAKLKVMRKE